MKKIVVDLGGADNSQEILLKGALEAINENKDIKLVLFGFKDIIDKELKNYSYDKDQLEIIDCKEEITNLDVPTLAIKEKKDSTLVKAMLYLKNDFDSVGLVSAGSTGAVLCSAIFQLGRLDNISRPTLASLLPTADGKFVCLLDCGANVDCKVENLVQFAIMGNSLVKAYLGIKEPRVALLNVGVESKKGNALVKAAYEEFLKLSLNFVGNMEAREALSGKYDVIVCDGFDGNILLKSIEGSAKFVTKKIAYSLFKNNNLDKQEVSKAINEVASQMDFNSLGGATLLGVKKIIVKAHGEANSNTIKNTINQVYLIDKGNMIEEMKNKIKEG